MSKGLKSIFADDMNRCVFTGYSDVERHHCLYNTSNQRRLCEMYNYVIPLWRKIHVNGASFDPKCEEYRSILRILGEDSLDEYLKKECERDYLQNQGTYEEWMQEFHKNYLEEWEIALWSKRT